MKSLLASLSDGELAIVILLGAVGVVILAIVIMFFSGMKSKKKAAAKKAKPVEKPAEKKEPEVKVVEVPVVKEVVVEVPVVKEVVKEVVVEKTPEPEQEPEEEVVEDEPETEEEEPESEDEGEESDSSIVMFGERLILVQYNRSFQSKLIQSDSVVQGYYGELKNELLSYEKVKARLSWTNDSFRFGRLTIARFGIRGKILSLYLAIDPSTLEESKYNYEDVSEIKKYEQTPTRLKLKSERAVKRAVELIEMMMKNLGVEMGREQKKDYSLPYETSEALIYRLLIKVMAKDENGELVTDLSIEEIINAPSEKLRLRTGKKVRKSVTLETAQANLSDEEAATFITKAESENGVKHAGKKAEISADAIAGHFASGDVVDLEALKEKGLVAKDVGSVTVVAGGTLSKALTVKAQEFSLDAVKMIVLTGGEAIQEI